MPAINWLDFVLIMLLAAGLVIGYFQGLLRQVIGLAALYIGAVLAAQYFHMLATVMKDMFKTTPNLLLDVTAFFIILLFVMFLINFLAYDAYKMTHLHLAPAIDHLGGMVIGMASMWVFIALALNVLTFAASLQNWADADTAREVLKQGILTSQIASAASPTIPAIMSTIRPWVPWGLPQIFSL